MRSTVKAKLEIAPIEPKEKTILDELQATARSPTWIGRFIQGFNRAAGNVTRSEFDRVCLKVVDELEGSAMNPDEAAAKAARLVKAYTHAHAGAMCPKCDYSDKAILVVWLGDPHSGFLFNKALTLKDPRGVKRAP